MHEHDQILPKYMLKCHLGPTQAQTNKWDIAQSRKSKNFAEKLSFPNPFKNKPNPRDLESKA